VIERDAKVQLSVTGKGGRTRQVLLPTIVSASLLNLRGDAGANDPVFASHKGGRRLWRRPRAICMPAQISRADSSWTRGFFVDEDEKGQRPNAQLQNEIARIEKEVTV
jgi:hypothetical protein